MRTRRGFTLVEVLVVALMLTTVGGFVVAGTRSSAQAAWRSGRLDGVRTARRALLHIESDLRAASRFSAPSFDEAALTLVAYDGNGHRIQYFNRDETGRNLFTFDEARAAERVSLVRVEHDEAQVTERVLLTTSKLDWVLFKRLGGRLVGVEVQLDPAEARLAGTERSSFQAMVALSTD